MGTLNLGLLPLILIYNLLINELNKPQHPSAELNTAIAEVNKALAEQQPNGTWFVCIKPGCDPRPYFLKPSELDSAQGTSACDVCGELCHRVSEEALQRTFLL
jgi:hypothetical protein